MSKKTKVELKADWTYCTPQTTIRFKKGSASMTDTVLAEAKAQGVLGEDKKEDTGNGNGPHPRSAPNNG